ncbi:unnamed protein product, partial [Pylaiella littoralis]
MPRRAAPAPLPVTILRGHSSGVQAVCFLNDNVLLSGSQDGMVKVWDLERRRACADFEATSQGMGIQRLDRLGGGKVVSQGRDMLIKVWDAERLASGGGGSSSSSGNRSGTPFTPEPLQELPAGGFHFCQFALTRWREEARATGKDTTNTTTNNGVARCDGGTGRGEEDKDGGVQERRKEEEKG